MFFCIRKRTLQGAVLCVCALLLLTWLPIFEKEVRPASGSVRSIVPATLVVDAGHGGEDGGAVTADGSVCESGVNLAIAVRICELARFLGVPVVMTRTEDISLHDPDARSLRERKASDLRNRAELVEQTENGVLLSIHQNSLPSSAVTHGAQVFWNSREGAEHRAQAVQEALNRCINRGNEKNARPIPDAIYLMNRISAPGILVECGFLSNREESIRLQEKDYQLRLAAVITAACRAI